MDDCVEFITQLTPVRLENLEKPIDFEKELLPLGYYKPKTKYEFKVCHQDNINDCVLRYSDEETYTPKDSDRKYTQVTDKYEMHGKTLYRTHSYVFKYESVKLKLDEGLKKDESGNNVCKEGYRSCGKFINDPLKSKYSILCFPYKYDCPYKYMKAGTYKLSGYSEHVQLENEDFLGFQRYSESDSITIIFTGFMYVPMSQQKNLANLPFDFTPTTVGQRESVFSGDLIDLRELLKENNIYSHYLDFYFKGIGIDTNSTFRLYFQVRFQNIYNDLEHKCYNKKEEKEEYVYDNFNNDCLTMIEHIEPIKMNSTEKVLEKDVIKLAEYIPEYDYEHFLCRGNSSSQCQIKYSNDAIYEKDADDLYYNYEIKNTTYIRDTRKPVYIFRRYAYRIKRLNIHFKETFDISLYKCKDGYNACARIKHHPWATLLCIPKGHYCPMNDIVGDDFRGYDSDIEKWPYNFKADGDEIKFHFNRYEMNNTIDFIAKSLYLRNGAYEDFDKLFPFSLGASQRGIKIIDAFRNRVDNMEKIFTENGIPTNFVKLYYPDDNVLLSVFDDRKTRMYICAESLHYKDTELVCDEPTSEKEVILYGIWGDSNKNNDGVTDKETEEATEKAKDKTTNEGVKYDDEESSGDSLRIFNLSILLFLYLVLI